MPYARVDRFLWLWFLLPLAALSLVKAKHHHYLIHSLPPCSFWAAEGLLRLKGWAERLVTRQRVVWAGWSVGVIALALAMGYCISAWPEYFRDSFLLGIIATVGTALFFAAVMRRRLQFALVVLFCVCWFGYGEIHASLMRKLDRFAEETAFLRRLNRPEHAGTHLLVYCYEAARILLYCDLPVEQCSSVAELRARYEELPQAYLLTSMFQTRDFQRVAKLQRVDKMEAGRWEGFGPLAQLAVFRVEWRSPPSSAISANPTEHSP
jgi:hypothetical protein